MPDFFSGYFGYILWMLPILLLSAFASISVRANHAKYSKINSRRGLTGAQVASMILMENGISDVQVVRVKGNLTDHFHPKKKYIGLSDSVYDSASIAALGIAAHEAGHAVQYSKGYAPIQVREAILPAVNLGSQLSWILIFIGLLLSDIVALAGIALFGLVVLFQLVTLPVEFNASHRAVAVLEGNGYLEADEMVGAKRVLRSAALTYVVALLASMWQMLRYIMIIFGGKRRR